MPYADPEKRKANQRAYQAKHKAELRAYQNEWRRRRYATDPVYRAAVQKNTKNQPPHVTAARMRLQRALKRGELVRPTVCSKCRRESFIEAAHRSYGREIDILWLCRSCHRKWDAEQPKGGHPNQATVRSSVPWRQRKTHCIHGHEYTPENTYIRPSGERACRICQRENLRRSRARRRQSTRA
jgi:hypothetical protein